MGTRRIVHEEPLDRAPADVFAMLVTPSSIRRWWGAHRAVVVARAGGFWAAAWGDREDDPDYASAARIAVYEPPRRLLLADFVYDARDAALPFEAEFQTEFEIEPTGRGCLLRVTQSGFPEAPIADAFYAGCTQGWRDTFRGIRAFLDAGAASDARPLA